MRSSLFRSSIVAAIAALFPAAQLIGQQVKALKFRSVVDGSGKTVSQGVVIVDGDKIVRVQGPRDALPANAQIVDLTRYTAIPGLIAGAVRRECG